MKALVCETVTSLNRNTRIMQRLEMTYVGFGPIRHTLIIHIHYI